MSTTVPEETEGTDVDHLVRLSAKFLLKNSAEGTFDLHGTLRRIGSAYGVKVESMIMMEGMVVVVNHPDGTQWTSAVHAEPSLERLDRVSDFRDLSERMTSGALTPTEALAELEKLEESRDPFPWWLRIIGVMLFSAGFAPSMQANWRQVGAAAVLGGVMALVVVGGERIAIFKIVLPLLGSTAVAVVAFRILHDTHPHGGPVLVMVPALFVMIPGDFLVAAAAEIAVGQFTVGTIRLAQSTLVLFELAGGVLIGAALCGVSTSDLIAATTVNNLPFWILAVAWIPFSIGMALTFCLRRKDFLWLLGGVYVAWGVQLFGTWTLGTTTGTFLAALVLALGGVLLGNRPGRPPALIIILGGVFVLTVGSMALRGLTALAGGGLVESMHDLSDFMQIAGGLTFGLILGMGLGATVLRRRYGAGAVVSTSL